MVSSRSPFPKAYGSGAPVATVDVLDTAAVAAGQNAGSTAPGVKAKQARGRKAKHLKRLNTNQKHALEIRTLEKKVAMKLAEIQQLELEHDKLQMEHQLLVACCDALNVMRLQDGEVDQIDEGEQTLLEQLQHITYGHVADGKDSIPSGCSAAADRDTSAHACGMAQTPAAAELQDPWQWRLSPPDDKMYYFRYMLALPPFPRAEQLTLEEFAADYANTVQRVSLQLHLLRQPFCQAQCGETPIQKIKAIVDRHFNILTTLKLQKREDLVQAFCLTNFETLESSEELCLERHKWMLQETDITLEQQAEVGKGIELFNRLLEPIIHERQQLQQQISALETDAHGAANYRQQLELHKQWLARLSLQLFKENQTRLAMAGWIAGCLTYVQVCMIMVKCAPYPASTGLLGKLLLEQYLKQRDTKHTKQNEQQVQ